MDTVEEVSVILDRERWRRGYDNLTIRGDLAILPSRCEALIVGDLHGDLQSLRTIFQLESLPEVLKTNDYLYSVFLGDYVDRGPYSVEVILVLLRLKLEFPDKVVLLRGNHEPPYDLLPYPHDLPYQVRRKYGPEGDELYLRLMRLFQLLYVAALVPQSVFLVHGGVPVNLNSIDDISTATMRHPEANFLEELLWNDPTESTADWLPSPRGAGKLFGARVTQRALSILGAKFLIRGHEPCEGYKLNHSGLVLTLFSRKGIPYFNSKAAYVKAKMPITSLKEYVRVF